MLGRTFTSQNDLATALKDIDCVIFMVDHKEFKEIDWTTVDASEDMVVVDTRNLYTNTGKFKYVGLGKFNS